LSLHDRQKLFGDCAWFSNPGLPEQHLCFDAAQTFSKLLKITLNVPVHIFISSGEFIPQSLDFFCFADVQNDDDYAQPPT
jgi:hypothetical protein